MKMNKENIKRIIVKFSGIEDDGLAARQTGNAAAIRGNAREALELFWTGVEYGRKSVCPSVLLHSRVLDTGDADMIKIPRHTEIFFELDCEEPEALRSAFEIIKRTAVGAALMTGCEVAVAPST